MIEAVLLDTGPLVALCNARDHFHDWACEQFKLLKPPFLTCEPVLAEACFLLGKNQNVILEMAQAGLFKTNFSLLKELPAIRRLIKKYSDVPMSLADACLVRMSELHKNSRVLTLDRDFLLYRKNGRQVVPRIMPD